MTALPILQLTGGHLSKFLILYVSGTNRNKGPNDRFPSVRDQIHANPTIRLALATPGQAVTGGS